MATTEHTGIITYLDESGNTKLLYPVTTMDAVDGLQSVLADKAPLSHSKDKNNPHGVTPEQIGARPITWMPTAEEVGARPAAWMPTAAQVGARPNTWLPSIAEIGAAPTGYGLGVSTSPVVSDINKHTANGWFRVTAGTDNTPCPYGIGMNYGYDGSNITQRVYDINNKGWIQRTTGNGGTSWTEWEWENPPLIEGKEYRTTERYNGKPVYTKAVYCSNFPSVATKSISISDIPIDQIISCEGFSDYLGLPLPYYSFENGTIKPMASVMATWNSITVSCAYGIWTQYTCTAIIKYTKK